MDITFRVFIPDLYILRRFLPFFLDDILPKVVVIKVKVVIGRKQETDSGPYIQIYLNNYKKNKRENEKKKKLA